MNENFEVTYDDIMKCSYNVYGVSHVHPFIPVGHIILWMGFPLVPKEGGDFIAFVRCTFCGQDDHAIENNRCAHCGGWIS